MDKKYSYWIVGVVAVLLVVWAIYASINPNSQQANMPIPDNTKTGAASTQPVTGAGTKKLSYGDAIKAYPERFQFSKCQGSPASIAVKKGTPVMLDNRDAVSHTIVADKQAFKLSGYDYAVLYPQALGNLVVTCDGKNRVMLNVQK